MSKKILLISRDPGGANTIIPLVNPLKDKGYNVSLYGKDVALEKYKRFNLAGKDITNHISDLSIDNLKEFLKKENPHYLITGTSADDMTEKYLWKAAELLQIPSFVILDQWMNYGTRFSTYGVADLEEYNIKKSHPYMPTKIFVMDEFAKSEMITEGIDPSRIVITGHPYFELVLKRKENISIESLKKFRNSLDIEDSDFVITYASEPLTKVYKKNDSIPFYWGYTEKTIYNEIIEALEKVVHLSTKKITFIIKVHPKEDIDSYKKIVDVYKNERINIIINKESDPWDSDVRYGLRNVIYVFDRISYI